MNDLDLCVGRLDLFWPILCLIVQSVVACYMVSSVVKEIPIN